MSECRIIVGNTQSRVVVPQTTPTVRIPVQPSKVRAEPTCPQTVFLTKVPPGDDGAPGTPGAPGPPGENGAQWNSLEW